MCLCNSCSGLGQLDQTHANVNRIIEQLNQRVLFLIHAQEFCVGSTVVSLGTMAISIFTGTVTSILGLDVLFWFILLTVACMILTVCAILMDSAISSFIASIQGMIRTLETANVQLDQARFKTLCLRNDMRDLCKSSNPNWIANRTTSLRRSSRPFLFRLGCG